MILIGSFETGRVSVNYKCGVKDLALGPKSLFVHRCLQQNDGAPVVLMPDGQGQYGGGGGHLFKVEIYRPIQSWVVFVYQFVCTLLCFLFQFTNYLHMLTLLSCSYLPTHLHLFSCAASFACWGVLLMTQHIDTIQCWTTPAATRCTIILR